MCRPDTLANNAKGGGGDEPGGHGRCNEAGDAQRGSYVDVDDGSELLRGGVDKVGGELVGHTDIIDCFCCRPYTNGSTNQSQHVLPFTFFCKERERRRDRRTEHADFDRLEFLEKCFPSRVIRRCEVDNERLGLYASTATASATCVDYIFVHSITHCIYEEERKKKPRTDIVYDSVEPGLVSCGEEDIESSSSKLDRKLASDAVRCARDD
jgi:hypothetical protein